MRFYEQFRRIIFLYTMFIKHSQYVLFVTAILVYNFTWHSVEASGNNTTILYALHNYLLCFTVIYTY